MTGFAILDLVIGIIFIYFLLSILCSAVQEIISGILRLRATTLNDWLRDAFDTGGLGNLVLEHKLIAGLTKRGRLASYFPADKLALAILDIVSKGQNAIQPYTRESLANAIRNTNLLHDDFKGVLLQAIAKAPEDIDAAKKFIESWFNDSMERVTGTYRKKVRLVVLIISIVTTALLNVDTIALSDYLYNHPEASKALADQASDATKNQAYKDLVTHIDELQNDSLPPWKDSKQATAHFERIASEIKTTTAKLESFQLPILSWKDTPGGLYQWIIKIIGLLLTSFAVSLGAPFWFDILGKLVNLRSAGRDPSKPGAPK
jgi:hypothetical protein